MSHTLVSAAKPKKPSDMAHGMSWGRFAAMLALSTLLMFPLMYQLVYIPDHATFSLTRLLGAFVMGAVMAVVMLGLMWKMYPSGPVKILVLAGAAVLAIVLLLINREQVLIDDVAFMRAMIPHHSIAINNAEKARLSDPRVRRLADKIISAQVQEIAEMQELIADISAHGKRGETPLAPVPAIVNNQMLPSIAAAVE